MEMEDEEVCRFNDDMSAEDAKGQTGYNQSIEDEDLDDEEGNKLVKICKICGKRFSSGRALGGHTRIHFAQPKLDPPKKLVFINQNQNKKLTLLMNDIGDDGDKIKKPKFECVCCHKSFDSRKALYGHMRSHPEREYRGVVPPPINRNSSSSNNSTLSLDETLKKMDDDLIKVCGDDDLVSDTPMRWHRTGKRGRKTTLVWTNSSEFCSSASSSEDEDERMNAVMVLMSLRSGGKYYDGDNTDGDLGKKKKHRQVKKLRDLDEAGPSNCDDQYKCRTCNKTFSSHQALGGHRSSHRKPVVMISEGKTTELKVKAKVQVEAESCSHQCELCGGKFETGQALGGHKRCHRTTNYTDDTPLVDQAVPLGESSQQQALEARDVGVMFNFYTDDAPLVEATSLVESSQQPAVAAPYARVMFHFDLNEPAFVDDEDL